MTLTAAELHGGCVEVIYSNDTVIALGYGRRLQVITVTTPGRTLTLPPTSNPEVPYGRNVAWLLNLGSNSFTLVDSEATFSRPIAPLQSGLCHVIRDLVGNKRFFVQQVNALT